MNQLHLHQPACYRFVVGGHVGDDETSFWSYTLICHHSHTAAGRPLTTMEGRLPDQAALHGILVHIRDWGLPLYLVLAWKMACHPISNKKMFIKSNHNREIHMSQKIYRFIARYQLPLFIGLAFALSAGIAAVAAAAGNESMAILTVLTPSLLAIGLTAVLAGKVGLADLLVKRFWGHPRWAWVAISCVLIPAVGFLAILIASFLGGPAPALRTTQLLPQIIVIIVISLGEEFGWRGYALPRLQQRYSPLMASLILGVIWGFWHFPGYLIGAGVPLEMPFIVFLLWVILMTILMTLVYNQTQSILLAIIMHSAANATFNYLPLLPEFTGQMEPFLLFLGLLGLVVTAVYHQTSRRLPRLSLPNLQSPHRPLQ